MFWDEKQKHQKERTFAWTICEFMILTNCHSEKYTLLFDFKWAKGRGSVFKAHTWKKFILIDHDLIINLQSVEKISNECFFSVFLLFNRLQERKDLNNLKEKPNRNIITKLKSTSKVNHKFIKNIFH